MDMDDDFDVPLRGSSAEPRLSSHLQRDDPFESSSWPRPGARASGGGGNASSPLHMRLHLSDPDDEEDDDSRFVSSRRTHGKRMVGRMDQEAQPMLGSERSSAEQDNRRKIEKGGVAGVRAVEGGDSGGDRSDIRDGNKEEEEEEEEDDQQDDARAQSLPLEAGMRKVSVSYACTCAKRRPGMLAAALVWLIIALAWWILHRSPKHEAVNSSTSIATGNSPLLAAAPPWWPPSLPSPPPPPPPPPPRLSPPSPHPPDPPPLPLPPPPPTPPPPPLPLAPMSVVERMNARYQRSPYQPWPTDGTLVECVHACAILSQCCAWVPSAM